ncbi:uncharacterized protein LOC131023329 [Salvia miltiorrhiza]|uniref:uncharacterized protein LOC131023329 n=1 Tax=Salvia miltiorrhiza TaxID=226208 RepID=UPI0025ABD6AC|nr:uncharacterized protein LOC131023329 [Salvia miltiorrhiza]
MSRELFLRIVNALEVDPYFQQRQDAVGRLSFSPIQKCTAAVRQLAYGTSADCCDEYLRIGESTALECLKKFCKAVVPGHEVAVHFLANNSHHTRGYYLTDGIYPDWPVFVKSFQFSNDEKKRRFKEMQEAARKDVERAFGVLQARWGGNASNFDGDDGEGPSSTPQTQFNSGAPPEFAAYLARNASLKDARLHARLRDDLVEHIWARFGPVDP